MSEPWEDPQEEIRELLDGVSKRLKAGLLPGKVVVGVALALAAVLGAFTSVYTVEPEEKAVVMRFGRYINTNGPGLHFRFPFGIDQVIKLPTERILHENFGFRIAGSRTSAEAHSIEEESLMLTGDLNVANVEWIVQYKISDPEKFLFNTRDVRKNLRDVSQSVLRRVVGDRTVSEVLTTGRVEIADEAKRLTQEILDQYDCGVYIQAVQLQDVNPPKAVRPAFNEVNSAKQEQEKGINEAEREYNRVIPKARGEAEQMIRTAEGYATAVLNRAKGDANRFNNVLRAYRTAPAVTRTRLYLEMIEEVYQRFSEMTIVDQGVKGILPVFTQGGGATLPPSPGGRR
ncbi:MAG: FtsH protease activity modulator HflK [Elusimicrobiota bacterium]